MKPRNNSLLSSFLFLYLFIAPQIVSFTLLSVNLVSFYWLSIFVLIIIIGSFTLPLFKKYNKRPLLYSIIFVLFGLFSIIINFSSFSDVLKILFPFIALVGYTFVSTRRIDLRVFDFFMICLYVFFYLTFYSIITNYFDRPDFNPDIYGHASTNTIAISLNVILFFYYILNRFYNSHKEKRILFFSVLNFILIIIQESRGGIIVAISILLLALYDVLQNKYSKKKIIFFAIGFCIILAITISVYSKILSEYMEIVGNMSGIGAIKEDVRGDAQNNFFEKMDNISFFAGRSSNYIFAGGQTRTYNAFLDLWSRYGIIPFVTFVYLLIVRIINYKNFSIPLYCFIPIFLYSFVESLWGGTLWDIIIFIMLFLSKKVAHDQKNVSLT